MFGLIESVLDGEYRFEEIHTNQVINTCQPINRSYPSTNLKALQYIAESLIDGVEQILRSKRKVKSVADSICFRFGFGFGFGFGFEFDENDQ